MICCLAARTEGLPALQARFGDRLRTDAVRVIIALARLGTPEARMLLQQVADEAGSPEARRIAAGALKDGLMPTLLAEVRRRDSPASSDIVETLLYLNDPAALPILEEVRRSGRASAARHKF